MAHLKSQWEFLTECGVETRFLVSMTVQPSSLIGNRLRGCKVGWEHRGEELTQK